MNEQLKTELKVNIVSDSKKNDAFTPIEALCIDENQKLDLRKFPNEKVERVYAGCSDRKSILDLAGCSSTLIHEIFAFLDYLFVYLLDYRDAEGETVYNSILQFRRVLPQVRNYQSIGDYITAIDDTSGMNRASIALYNKMVTFWSQYQNPNDIYVWDEWNLRSPRFSEIPAQRKNPTSALVCFHFHQITNLENRRLVTKYIDYLLYKTQLTLDFINSRLYHVRNFCKYLDCKSLLMINEEDISGYIEMCHNGSREKPLTDNTICEKFNAIRDFYDFLCFREWLNKNPFLFYWGVPEYRYQPKESAIDITVIHKIYNILPSFPPDLAVVLLVIHCTGIRISEALMLRKIGLLSNLNGDYYLNYYSQKFQKWAPTKIPENLHSLLKSYAAFVKDNGSVYLFPAMNNGPMLYQTFRDKIIIEFSKHKILNPDGSEYVFRAHDYRHTQAVDLKKLGAPIALIAQRLSHASLDMTLKYAEYRESDKERNMADFESKMINTSTFSVVSSIAKRPRKAGDIVLPFGGCGRNPRLGPCSQSPAQCSGCPFVRCGREHAAVLSDYSQKLQNAEEQFNQKGQTEKARQCQNENKELLELMEKWLNE